MLERHRKLILYDPVKTVKYDITADGISIELCMLVYDNDKTGFKTFRSLEDNITKALASNGVDATAEVTAVTGGLFRFQHNFNPRTYVQEDYPEIPGKVQWDHQESFGRKTVVQYEKKEFAQDFFDAEGFVGLVDSIIGGDGKNLYDLQTYTDVGDGLVIIADSTAGSVILVWDGKEHVDLNFFLHDDTEFEIKEHLEEFEKLTKLQMAMTLRDDFPRGTGRVMNFRADMIYHGVNSVVDPEPYVDMSDDE